MQRTLRDKNTVRLTVGVILLLAFAAAIAGSAEDYRAARTELIAAYQAEDFSAMRTAAEKALEARPGYAGGLFNLAYAQVLDDDAEASLSTLQQLLHKKIDFAVVDIEEFAPVTTLPTWASYAAAVETLYEPIGEASVAYTYSDGGFVPEGIAIGADDELYLGSIRNGSIVRIGESIQTLVTAGDGPHWSVFGMRYAEDGRLWFVSSGISEFAKLDPADEGRNGLYAMDTASGEIVVRAPLPDTGNKQVLGDLILVDDDTLFLADQADGIVYRYRISTGDYSVLLERGALASPQGLVLDQAGDYLYVADYIGGLFRISVNDGSAEKVMALDSASDYGIDGLYRYNNELIGIQNGIRPNRVVAFTLSDDGKAIVSSRILAMNLQEFDEPNLGVIKGDDLLFIANSHWNRFDRDGNLPEDLAGPVVLRIKLDN